MIKHYFVLALIALLLSLGACGGGETPTPQPSDNWDEMVWDQDNWQ